MELQSSCNDSLQQDDSSQWEDVSDVELDDTSQWEDASNVQSDDSSPSKDVSGVQWHESSEWEDVSEDVWLLRPISQSINDHLGKAQPAIFSPSPFLAGLEIWDWMSVTLGDQVPSVSLFPFLSISQVNSYKLLLEWWQGRTQMVAPSEYARKVLSDSKNNSSSRDRSKALKLYSKNTKSRYNRAFSRLFQIEFCQYVCYDDSLPLICRILLHRARQVAAEIAACQRLAHSFYSNHIKISSPQDKENLSKSEQMRKEMDNHIGACIQPCRWLEVREKKENQLPRYLWDVAAKQTVLTTEIKESPQYITISHTWGRWRIRDRPRVKIQGVPWLVPENTRFCIQDLPDELQRLPFSCTYIWFDLLCIPQDRSDEARLEISRQAAIFAGAACSVVWLNEVETWNSVEKALHWLIIRYMKEFARRTHNISNEILDEMIKIVEALPTDPFDGDNYRPGWLSSLWTLQEACLRPDMFICNRAWQILTINPGVPVPLDTIIALGHQMTQSELGTVEFEKESPKVVQELYCILYKTGLMMLLIMSRISILIFGDQRCCEARRAEAIMSVLGMTDWFNDHLIQSSASMPDDNNLVLGKYPISFVREIKKKLGAAFFGEFRAKSTRSPFNKFDQVEPNISGTMLPFQSGYSLHIPTSASDHFYNQDHSTIKDWEVLLDGSVRITNAAIIGWPTNSDKNDIETIAHFSVWIDGKQKLIDKKCSLPSWFQSFHPHLQKHAICLAKDVTNSIRAVVLMQTSSKSNDFIKIGSMRVVADEQKGHHIPLNTIACDWRVF
ncbi:hypothetical protein MMC14_009673 [Varicellaria rhodocarpa]|nr:hypothetical protein [Varicellaria rhodocarpa]